MNKQQTERTTSWLILGLMWALLLGLSVLRPLAVPDEGRYGDIGRWMLLSGDWLTPRLNGIPFFHKPPFLYWLQSAALGLLGVNVFALRLISALHVGLMMVALYLSARVLGSERLARRAAIMLGTSLSFLVGGQYVNHDMLVAAWIGVAIWCFAFSFMAGPRPDALLARLGFVACALGMLSKGLIGVALPGMVLLFWLVWTRQLRKVLWLPWLSGLGLFALLVAPWFVLAQQKYPELLNYMFVHHHFARYTARSFNNPQPLWFYLAAIGLLLFPWAFFTLGALRGRGQQVLQTVPAQRPWISLCWIWVVAITVFFSIPSSKLVGYILPVIPAVALLAAVGWERVMAPWRWSGHLFVALCGLNLALALTLVLKVGAITAPARTQDIARVLACEARPSDTIYTTGGFPYDLPFYIRAARPMVVVQDWTERRANAGDGWERELFEGADFDPATAGVLQSPQVLAPASTVAGNWLVVPSATQVAEMGAGWRRFAGGAGWTLYRSSGSAPESPVAAQRKGLAGCEQQAHEQGHP